MSLTTRPPVDADRGAILDVVRAQDVSWWGQAEVDDEEFDQTIAQIRRACGSIETGGRVAVRGGEIVGFAARLGHGHTWLAALPDHDDARLELIDWLIGGDTPDDVLVDAPTVDAWLIDALADSGLVHRRSSFELERTVPVTDLDEPVVAADVTLTSFDPLLARGVYAAIYSVWTEVEGHTARAYDEWHDLLVDFPSFDPRINVVAERDGAVVGAAMCRMYPGPTGWVSQLAVSRPAQGVGLGRALLTEAFCRMDAHYELQLLGLGVEAKNASALGLYRSVGLDVAREWRHYARPTREVEATSR
ncbi:MAG: GNAT family N-acetyltransferase [Actinomycetota bacterium]